MLREALFELAKQTHTNSTTTFAHHHQISSSGAPLSQLHLPNIYDIIVMPSDTPIKRKLAEDFEGERSEDFSAMVRMSLRIGSDQIQLMP